jgi:hypothetical protein
MKHFGDALVEEFEELAERAPLVETINRPGATRKERCDALYAFYRKVWPKVKAIPACDWAIDPYEIDWPMLFTPIEQALWTDIRQEGLVLYPQHPVAGYFVDFGHPKVRVAIECDGKEYHTNRTKDAVREQAIRAKGWTVYRFTGSQCIQDYQEVDDWDTGAPKFIPSETRQRIREIAHRHGLSRKRLEQR